MAKNVKLITRNIGGENWRIPVYTADNSTMKNIAKKLNLKYVDLRKEK